MIKILPTIIGVLLVVGAPGLPADEQVMPLLVQDAAAAEPVEEDQAAALRDLCEGYAEEENIAEDKRADHVDDCVASMTDMTAQEPPVIEEQSDVPVIQEATHPEELIADELVEAPAPGVEELVPAGVETVDQKPGKVPN